MLLSWLLLLCLVNFITAQDESRLVQLDHGPVRGYKSSGQAFYSFFNIPYATITKRFQAADPPPTWTEPFEAINRRIICPQRDAFFVDTTNTTMQEDCLVINIFVPDTNETNLPVLVDIPGGAFFAGYGDAYKYTSMVAKNVIAVTFNYRVGMLGFLCLGTKKIPGNAGMKDQVTALRWVKRNIASFGGNPDDVTITGCSAGGASADLLLISKAANGLFAKAIVDSGASLSPYALLLDPVQNAKDRARDLNFTDVDNISALEEFFINVPYEVFNQMQSATRHDSTLDNGLCVESDVGEEMFLDDSPYNILVSGNYTKYPTIFGVTNKEGSMVLGGFQQSIAIMNNNFSAFLPGDLQFDNEEQKEAVAQIVKEFYFGNQSLTSDSLPFYIDYHSDMFAYGVYRSIRLHVEGGHNSIFLFEYSYEDVPGILEGASHCAQARAVRDEDENGLSEQYRRVKAVMREIWYNFITTSNPIVAGSPITSWPPVVGTNRSPHMSVGRTLELRGALEPWRARFWDSIYKRFYRTPIPPNMPPTTDSASAIAVQMWLTSIVLTLHTLL